MAKGPVLADPLFERWGNLRQRLDAAARRAGRVPESVEVVAVVKYAALEDVRAFRAAGFARWYGESRVHDAAWRREALGEPGRPGWRLIGHLQTNKAKAALELFDHIDTLDSLALAEALERRLEGTDRRVGVMAQVKLTERESQSGVVFEEAAGLVARLGALPHLRVEGLMGIAPLGGSPEAARPAFRRLKALYDGLFAGPADPAAGPWLSMGMSGDCAVAVEEGATMVRVGGALFGNDLQGQEAGPIGTRRE